MASVATHNKRHVKLLAIELYGPGIALIVVRVGRHESMRVDPLSLADGVDLAQIIGGQCNVDRAHVLAEMVQAALVQTAGSGPL